MIISAVSNASNYKVSETQLKKPYSDFGVVILTPQKERNKKKKIAKKIVIGIGLLTVGFTADLFLAKGKALSTLTRGKVSFIKNMSDDIDNVLQKDSYATKSRLEAFLSVPGLHAVWNHRVIHKLNQAKVPVLPRFMANVSRFLTGIEIHPGAKIGKNLFIDHTGAIIGETAQIGNNVTIIGRAVLGSTGKGEYLRHTIVEDNVTIGMNATMLGRITLGKDSKIGAGALVTHDVPKGATVIGNPAKIIALNNERLEKPINLTKDSSKEIQQYLKNKKGEE
jgi:serine O-acetyltransferase